ncbi:hypothetical protein ACA910_002303 [Epithemia clementina (nom. ined.)]
MHVDLFTRIRGGGTDHQGTATNPAPKPGTAANNQANQNPNDNPQCSHCKGRKTIHTGEKLQCPFRELSAEKARAAAKDVREAVANGSEKDVAALVLGALAKHK